jgi:hypothetical protein
MKFNFATYQFNKIFQLFVKLLKTTTLNMSFVIVGQNAFLYIIFKPNKLKNLHRNLSLTIYHLLKVDK